MGLLPANAALGLTPNINLADVAQESDLRNQAAAQQMAANYAAGLRGLFDARVAGHRHAAYARYFAQHGQNLNDPNVLNGLAGVALQQGDEATAWKAITQSTALQKAAAEAQHYANQDTVAALDYSRKLSETISKLDPKTIKVKPVDPNRPALGAYIYQVGKDGSEKYVGHASQPQSTAIYNYLNKPAKDPGKDRLAATKSWISDKIGGVGGFFGEINKDQGDALTWDIGTMVQEMRKQDSFSTEATLYQKAWDALTQSGAIVWHPGSAGMYDVSYDRGKAAQMGLLKNAPPPAPPPKYNTAQDVRQALARGKITRDQALKILRTDFGMK